MPRCWSLFLVFGAKNDADKMMMMMIFFKHLSSSMLSALMLRVVAALSHSRQSLNLIELLLGAPR